MGRKARTGLGLLGDVAPVGACVGTAALGISLIVASSTPSLVGPLLPAPGPAAVAAPQAVPVPRAGAFTLLAPRDLVAEIIGGSVTLRADSRPTPRSLIVRSRSRDVPAAEAKRVRPRDTRSPVLLGDGAAAAPPAGPAAGTVAPATAPLPSRTSTSTAATDDRVLAAAATTDDEGRRGRGKGEARGKGKGDARGNGRPTNPPQPPRQANGDPAVDGDRGRSAEAAGNGKATSRRS